jgi:hypothetical protein
VLELTGNPTQSNWTNFLKTLAAELKGEWIYRGHNEKKPKKKHEVMLTIESSFDREFSNLWLEDRKKISGIKIHLGISGGHMRHTYYENLSELRTILEPISQRGMTFWSGFPLEGILRCHVAWLIFRILSG